MRVAQSRPAPTALLLLAGALAACGTRRTPLSQSPSPGPTQASDLARLETAALNRKCEACHQQIAQEWRGSLHRQSFSNASFQRAFEREPLAFCQGCHAPLADPTLSPPPALAELGVACVSCHTPKMVDVAELGAGAPTVLAAPGTSGVAMAPHGLLRSSAFGTSGACAGCHEFAFPDAAQRGHTALMQSTLSEQRTAHDGVTSCADCHMPRLAPGAQRSHSFAASRDREFLRRAARFTAERIAPERVRVQLAPAYLGHAFPTGDLFRRLLVEAEAVGADYRLLAARQRFLTRHFARIRQSPSLELLELRQDDRVGLAEDTPTLVELDLGPDAVGVPVAWRVAYQRVAYPNGVDEANAVVEAEEELASGSLPAATSSSVTPTKKKP